MNKKTLDISELIKLKKYKKAQILLRKSLKSNPNDPEILRVMGVVILHLKNPTLAEKYFKKSYSIDPNSIAVLLNLASLYKLKLDYSKAIKWINKAVEIDQNSIPTLYNYANLLRANAQFNEAQVIYLKVLETDPVHYGALINMGHICKNNGNIDKAANYYHQVLNINANDGNIYLALSNLKKYKFTEDEILQINYLLDSTDPSINKVSLYFAKVKVLEDQDKHKESFDYLTTGNKLRYNSFNRLPVNWSQYSTDIKHVFSENFISKFKNCGNSSNSPIFIVSMPRAGSTLIEQILASHSKVNGASELPYIPSLIKQVSRNITYPFSFQNTSSKTFETMGNNYVELSERWSKNTDYFTDKLPDNLSYLGAILLSLPNAKVIYSVRNPIDVTLSCYRQNFAVGNQFSFNIKELTQYYHHHVNIMNYWQKVFPNKILKVNYEDLVMNTKISISRMLEFCHLNWQESCMKFHQTKRNIRTASAGQVTEKMYTQSINRYEKYGNKLDKLKKLIYFDAF